MTGAGDLHIDRVNKMVDLGTRVEVEESLPSLAPSERRPLEAKIMLRSDGTYTILRKP
jgi:hypothetical protein